VGEECAHCWLDVAGEDANALRVFKMKTTAHRKKNRKGICLTR
jgi:hypothetical protein